MSAKIAAQAPPTKVEVAPVRRVPVAPTQWLVGTVRPRLRTGVASELAGLVAELPVDVGDFVRKGQVLCKLRNDQRRFLLEEATATEAQLAAVLAERAAERRKAEFEHQRLAKLWEEQRGTEKEHNDAREDHRAALGREEQAARALDAQRAVVKSLADDLARTEIRAPFDGFVVTKRTEVGAWLEAGGGVVDLIDLATVRIGVPVPESAVAFCSVGETVQVNIDALGLSVAGRIGRIVPDADERARTFPVEIDVVNGDGRLRAGMFARVAVPAGQKTSRLVVPKDAVVLRGPLRQVFVVRAGPGGETATPLPVEVVSEVVERVAVEAPGLEAGDRVVVRGNEYLFGPAPVVIMTHGDAPASGPAVGGAAAHHDGRVR